MLLGIAALLGSWGLQTIWAPPEEKTAQVRSDVVDAPLTVITSGIQEVSEDDPITYELKAPEDGSFTLMLGQTRDVEAWVGDAAVNTITGINTDTEDRSQPEVVVEHTAGETEIPDPRTSDLWIATQDVEGQVSQRWTQLADGEWSVLVVAEDGQPAPTDLSVTFTDKEPDSPWITPLMIIGFVLIVVGLLLLLRGIQQMRARSRRPSGRRAVGQPLTTAIPVVEKDPSTEAAPVREDAPDPITDLEQVAPTEPGLNRVSDARGKELMDQAPVGGTAVYDSVDFYQATNEAQPTPVVEDELQLVDEQLVTTPAVPVLTDEQRAQAPIGGAVSYDSVDLKDNDSVADTDSADENQGK